MIRVTFTEYRNNEMRTRKCHYMDKKGTNDRGGKHKIRVYCLRTQRFYVITHFNNHTRKNTVS